MPGRVGQITGNPASQRPRKERRKKRKPPAAREVAGPYRSQSSNPKIRSEATSHEHRREPATVAGIKRKEAAQERRTVTRKAAAQNARKARRQSARKARRIEHQAQSILQKAPPTPHAAVEEAKRGVKPPQSKQWRKAFPEAAKKADSAFLKHVASKENLGEPEDITHAIEVATLATGVGGAIKGAIKVGEVGGEALLAKDAVSGAASAGSSAGSKVAKAAREVKGGVKARAGAKAERIRTTPERIKTAPRRAKTAASTKGGRRAARKGAYRKVRRHPVRTGYGAAAVSPVPLPGEADKRARAAAEGTFNAITQHPLETGETTLRSLPAAIVGPAELLGAGASSIKHGSLEPLKDTVTEQAEGVGHILGQTFSGDPKKAEEAARKEGSLALATPLPALSRLKAARRIKGSVREAANTARRKVASRSDTLNAKVRHSPEGAEPRVSGHSERKAQRKQTALIKQRIDNPHRIARTHHEAAIAHAAAKMPKDSFEALQVLAEYGARDPRHIQLLRDSGPKDKALVKALDILEKHPEIWKHKATAEALAATKAAAESAPAAVVGKGERARLMQQGDVFGHTRPEHMPAEGGKPYSSATTREGQWADLASADKQLTQLKKRGRERLDQAKVLKGPERAQALKEGKALYADARALRASNQKLYDALDPFTRPDQHIDTSKRTPYEGRMLDEYKQKVEVSRKQAGLAPAIWTHHAPLEQAGAGLEGAPGQKAAMGEHMREGNLAKADNLDRSLEGLVRGTVHLPRQKEAARQFMRAIADQGKASFMLDGKKRFVIRSAKDWKAITTRKSKENPNGGQIDPKSYGRLALREWKGALTDPFMGDAERTQTLLGLLDEAEKGHVKGHEPSLLVPREMIKEARAQLSPQHNEITKVANLANRGAVRTLLGTNPAWFLAQIPAVGIAAILSEPRLLNPIYAGRIYHEILRRRKTDPEGALAMEGAAGAQSISSASLRTPLDMQEALTPVEWARGAKALTRGKTARSLLSFAKLEALGRANARFESDLRQVVYAMKADRQFRSWHKAVTGMFDTQAELSKRFRNQPREKLWEWLEKDTEGKRWRNKLEDQMDGAVGNWTAFTRFERAFAPLAIFYGFLRYSLRWAAWTFPRDHPINATMAYMLGQANANQIEKMLGQKYFEEGLQPTNAPARPENPLAFAMPVYSGIEGKKGVLPGGTRISPGQSSLTQALGSGNPAAILSSANLAIAAGIVGLTGIEPFTGEKTSKPKGWAALEQITGLPYPLRARLPFLDNQSLSEKGLQALGAPDRSVASKAYEELDPNKNIRSGLLPLAPQTAADFTGTEALSKAFSTKYGEGHVPGPFDSKLVQDLLYGGKNGTPQPQLLPKVLKQIHGAERASVKVKGAEAPFYPPSKPFSATQKELLQAVEDAWKTGPNAEPEEVTGGKYGGSSKYSSGNKYLEGNKYTEGNKYLGG